MKKHGCQKWISEIAADNISSVVSEIRPNDAKMSIECLVAITNLLVDKTKNSLECKSSPRVILQLTDLLCSSYLSEPSTSTLRYLTCLYHIAHYMLEKNQLDLMADIVEHVMSFKRENCASYNNDAKKLHDHFKVVLQKAIFKVASCESYEAIMLRLCLQLVQLHNKNCGRVLLETVLQLERLSNDNNYTKTVCLIETGLHVFCSFTQNEDLPDLSLLYNIYQYLFIAHRALSDAVSALLQVKKQLECLILKLNGSGQCEYYMFLTNAVDLFVWRQPEEMLSKLQKNNEILKTFHLRLEDCNVTSTCAFMLYLLVLSKPPGKQNRLFMSEACLDQFLTMVLEVCKVLGGMPKHKLNILRALSDLLCTIMSIEGSCDNTYLTRCITHILNITEGLKRIMKELGTDSRLRSEIPVALARFANLLIQCRRAKLREFLLVICKPFCKFLLAFHTHFMNIPQCSNPILMCFVSCAWALGTHNVEKAFECLVVLVAKYPENSATALKVWADLKHNVKCEGLNGLDINILSLVNKNKAAIEVEWGPFSLSTTEIANYLVQELKLYYIDKCLRGEPVISAADALLSLNVDCLSQAKGLVIAMDVATCNMHLKELCQSYQLKSKQLENQLRKEKKNLDPVEYNCSMGDLLYAQFRCQLKRFRTECECEMLKLTVNPADPLVAELPENRRDPHDTCDVAARCKYLCFDKQHDLMINLSSAIRHWGFVCGMLKDGDADKRDLEVTLNNLRDTGALLKLYCDELNEVKVWNLLYDMALVVGNINMALLAGSELLTTNTKVPTKMMTTLEELSNNPNVTDAASLKYKLNLLYFALKHNKIGEGLTLLDSLEEFNMKYSVQLCQYQTILGQFQSLPHWQHYNKTYNSSPSALLSLYRSIRSLLNHIESFNWSSFAEVCEEQLEVFKVCCISGEMNWAMVEPREARMYLRTALPIAQKLGLPIRTVQLLVLLAWVDVDTGVVADCAVKLDGLENLLELCGTPETYVGGHLPDSPTINKTKIREPEYLTHPQLCECLHCSTVEYQRLVLETLTLRATLIAACGHPNDAVDAFNVAKQVEEKLRTQHGQQVYKSCARMWIRLASVYAKTEEYGEAVISNRRALELLPLTQDPLTMTLANEQKFALQCIILNLQFPPICAKVYVKTTTPSEMLTPSILKKSQIAEKSPLATINSDIKTITPSKIPVRHFKPPSSGEENSPIPVPKEKRKPRPPPKLTKETPKYKVKYPSLSVTQFRIAADDDYSDNISGTKGPSWLRKRTVETTPQNNPSDTKAKKTTTKAKKTTTVDLVTKQANTKTMRRDLLNSLEMKSVDSNEPTIVRKSKRPVIKTYQESKVSSRPSSPPSEKLKTTQEDLQSGELWDKLMTDFEKMNEAIDVISIPKKDSVKTVTDKVTITSECDNVAGTSTPPIVSRIHRRVTQVSKK